ncbi:3-dehydroquinate synthase II [Pseudomonas putida]
MSRPSRSAWLRPLLAEPTPQPVAWQEFEIIAIQPAEGLYASVDLCSSLAEDEGLLVGGNAMRLLHVRNGGDRQPGVQPLNFIFDVGTPQSFVHSSSHRLRQTGLLQSAESLLAVRANGQVRSVVIGRLRISRGALLTIRTRNHAGTVGQWLTPLSPRTCLTGQHGQPLALHSLAVGQRVMGLEPNLGWIDGRLGRTSTRPF